MEDLSNLTLYIDSEEVVVYIAGYISHCLLKRTQCECCIHLLNTGPVSNAYVYNLDGGLKLTPSALNKHVQTAFVLLEYTEQKIFSFQTPWKKLLLIFLTVCRFVGKTLPANYMKRTVRNKIRSWPTYISKILPKKLMKRAEKIRWKLLNRDNVQSQIEFIIFFNCFVFM